jgi:glycosyltransferase involved in cell wall biosynthesis
MRQIKLLLVSPCQGAYGGIEAFVLALAEALRREPDFAVRVCLKKVKNFRLDPTLAAMVHHEAVTFVDRAGKDLADAIRWADLVHLQNASPDVVFLTKIFRKPVALTIHNYLPREWSLHRSLWRLAARCADARWYNSEFVWRTWEGDRKHAGSRKVATVSRLPEGWVPPSERRGFVFVGRWIPNKGVETLVDAYAKAGLDPGLWPLVMMGEGPLRQPTEAVIRDRGITGIQVIGFADEKRKADLLKRARWAVVPPHTNEDFGLTAIEARHVGVPCIITRDGGLPEAGGEQALVCEPNNPDALAALLQRAATMKEAEYTERANRTREELKKELEPLDFYPRAYRCLMRGEPIP